MDEQKRELTNIEAEETKEESKELVNPASRARNRTVVLTPDVAGQVRAILHSPEGDRRRDPLSEILPPMSPDQGKGQASKREAETPAERPGAAVGLRGSSDPHGYARPSRKGGTAKFQAQNAAEPSFQANIVHPTSPLYPVHAAPARVERKSKVVGFLVSYDKKDVGDVFEICQGRWLLTSKSSDQGDQIVIDDPTISPLHAIIRVAPDGKVQVLDQLSEYGSGVLRAGATEEEEVSGSMVVLNHGDRVRFGKRYFVVSLVPTVPLPKKDEAADV